MAELAASVGHQLINVDYDNNKHDYSNDNNSIHASSVRRIHHEPGGGGGGGPGCLVDLNPSEFQPADCQQVRLSEAAVDTLMSTGDDSASLTAVTGCDATTSNTPCARCGLRLHHHHHHLHHLHGQQLPQPQSLVYGQFCTDGSFDDERYPVGLRTPQ